MRPHVHCYRQYPPQTKRDLEHCVRDEVVLGPYDNLVINGVTYHPLVEFVGDVLQVKLDPGKAQIATKLKTEGDGIESKELVGAGAGFNSPDLTKWMP